MRGHNFIFKISVFRSGSVISCLRMTTHECIRVAPLGRYHPLHVFKNVSFIDMDNILNLPTELDRENLDFPPYLISHGQKIGSSRVLLATRWEVTDCVCAALQVWSTQCGRNISALEVVQNYSVSLRALFSKDLTRPNFCSIADGAIICGGIGSPGSPYLILWIYHTKQKCCILSLNHTKYMYKFVRVVTVDLTRRSSFGLDTSSLVF